jgi:photosystem II stability/assembly factor-like uncharacterized protein
MKEDELTEALRRTLRHRAEGIEVSPADPDRVGSVEELPVYGPRRRSHRTYLLATAVAAAAAAVIAVILLGESGGRHAGIRTSNQGSTTLPSPTTMAPSPSTVGTPPTTTAQPQVPPVLPATTVPAVQQGAAQGRPSVPAGFDPVSVTFVSASDGWILGSVPCGTTECASMAHTTDGGATWSPAGAPAVKLAGELTAEASVRYADPEDGWVYFTGPGAAAAEIWSTHDGGATWATVSLPGGGTKVADLEASGGVVRAAVLSPTGATVLLQAPAGNDSWSVSHAEPIRAGAGPVPNAYVVLHGAGGWAVAIDRTVTGGARLLDGAWANWSPPCSGANGPAVLGAASAVDLAAVCAEGAWGTPDRGTIAGTDWLFVSHDGGTSFSRVAEVPSQSVDGLTSAPGTSATIVASDGEGLLASFDGGSTWTRVYSSGAGRRVRFVGFTTAGQGVAIESAPDGSLGSVLMTHDGGHTWQRAGL